MRSPLLGLLARASAVALAVVVALPGTARAGVLERPDLADLAATAAFADGNLSAREARTVERDVRVWGGRLTTAGGERVTIWFSTSYPEDAARAHAWANYMGRLVHGSELGTVTTYLLPLAEVQSVCGRDAFACFGRRTIVAPGEDPSRDTSAESVLAHEYGHHVAASRSNAPWSALDWGTKRWASYEQVCRGARAGLLFPGAEDGRYDRNPGEAFAEVYRVLNERRLALRESPWEIVTAAFYPDGPALARLQADVVSPWSVPTTESRTGALWRRGTRSRVHRVATPYDGTLRVSVRAPSGLRARVQLRTGAGTRVAQTVVAGTTRTLATTVCGARRYRIRVTRLAGSGRYRLRVSRP
ncbi:MAG: hypothetical protein M3327_03935 [Actinomycetota bacterium]|nr:hypothetical protein [Actinomycetota bacterium]